MTKEHKMITCLKVRFVGWEYDPVTKHLMKYIQAELVSLREPFPTKETTLFVEINLN